IKYYRHLPVLLHDIDPKVDQSRDMLASQVSKSQRFVVDGFSQLMAPVLDGGRSDYETDGKILVLSDASTKLPSEVIECLELFPHAS
ncbi:MAG: hypothetical protein AAGF25_08990, partial [Pseudomonadota bacterium]